LPASAERELDRRAHAARLHQRQADRIVAANDPLSALLQNCANPSSVEPKGPKFFRLTLADQVVTAFDQIGPSSQSCTCRSSRSTTSHAAPAAAGAVSVAISSAYDS